MRVILALFCFCYFSHAKEFQHSCHYGQPIKHTYYQLCYDDFHKQSFWTAHRLTLSALNGNQTRTNDFRVDPYVLSRPVYKYDYRGSGHDRGHLVPAGDMKLNHKSMSESFYMSNMSPQKPGFNRGVWLKIENQVRRWAKEHQSIYVVTGPILTKNLSRLKSQVSIPELFYKIVYIDHPQRPKMYAFLIANEKSKQDISSFLTSVDRIEALAGIDFFTNLPSTLQSKLESIVESGI